MRRQGLTLQEFAAHRKRVFGWYLACLGLVALLVSSILAAYWDRHRAGWVVLWAWPVIAFVFVLFLRRASLPDTAMRMDAQGLYLRPPGIAIRWTHLERIVLRTRSSHAGPWLVFDPKPDAEVEFDQSWGTRLERIALRLGVLPTWLTVDLSQLREPEDAVVDAVRRLFGRELEKGPPRSFLNPPAYDDPGSGWFGLFSADRRRRDILVRASSRQGRRTPRRPTP